MIITNVTWNKIIQTTLKVRSTYDILTMTIHTDWLKKNKFKDHVRTGKLTASPVASVGNEFIWMGFWNIQNGAFRKSISF